MKIIPLLFVLKHSTTQAQEIIHGDNSSSMVTKVVAIQSQTG